MAQDVKSETQLLEALKQQGFSEDVIAHAIRSTDSRRIEDIVDFIEDLQASGKKDASFEMQEKKLKDEMRKRREETMKNKVYLQQIREQIEADRLEKQENSARFQPDLEIVKTEPIADFGECTVKVRHERGSSILSFKKTNTTADLIREVEKILSGKSFKLFLVNPPAEIIASDLTLDEVGLAPTGMVIVQK